MALAATEVAAGAAHGAAVLLDALLLGFAALGAPPGLVVEPFL